jgi:cell division protein ZapA
VPQLSVTINGRQYRMACEDGQEDHLSGLAQDFDRRIGELRASLGEIGDMRLMVVAALMLADELSETRARAERLQGELDGVQENGASVSERTQATQAAVVAALNAASERIEQVSRTLNQTLTESVPLG